LSANIAFRMGRFFLMLVLCLCFTCGLKAQIDSAGTTPLSDSVSILMPPKVSLDSCRKIVLSRSFIPVGKPGYFLIQQKKIKDEKSWMFYYLFLILFLFSLLKLAYPRYLQDLLRVFFRTSLKANQIREQLVQSTWQSLVFNGLFCLSAGYYLFLLADQYNLSFRVNVRWIPIIAGFAVLLSYLFKYFFLRLTGWIFQVERTTDTYIFIVFLVNKVLGIVLLPFLVILSFAPPLFCEIGFTVSLAAAGILLFYRYLLGYQAGITETRFSRFHFFIYILAMEVAPLLLIYRLLFNFF